MLLRARSSPTFDALEEAIRIIREIWATDERGGVRLKGKYYQLKWHQTRPRARSEVCIVPVQHL